MWNRYMFKLSSRRRWVFGVSIACLAAENTFCEQMEQLSFCGQGDLITHVHQVGWIAAFLSALGKSCTGFSSRLRAQTWITKEGFSKYGRKCHSPALTQLFLFCFERCSLVKCLPCLKILNDENIHCDIEIPGERMRNKPEPGSYAAFCQAQIQEIDLVSKKTTAGLM